MLDSLYWWDIPTLFRCPVERDPSACDIALVGVPHSAGNGTTEKDQHLGPRSVRNVSAVQRRVHLPFGLDPWNSAEIRDLGDVPFPWGGRLPDDVSFMPCNIWQGTFPSLNTQADGYATTAPAQSFEPNGYGLFNMCGNVWEWAHDPYKIRSLSKKARNHAAAMKGRKVLKGGSYMCHQSYCFRYRIPARVGNTPDTTTAHQGFRLAFDLDD